MMIPIVPHTTVINNNIIYSDTVLPLKDLGSNLTITSIDDIYEYNLESCLKKVFESNPDTVFNTVQYSQKDNKLYLYTDKKISTKEWKDSRVIYYEPLTSTDSILKEIKNVLASDKNNDPDSVCLFDVVKVMIKKYLEYDTLKREYQDKINDAINEKLPDTYTMIHDYDYDKNTLRLSFRYFKKYDDICFRKNNNDLYISSSETTRDKEVLQAAGKYISELYGRFNNYRDFIKQAQYNIKSVNSNFDVDISSYGVTIEYAKQDYNGRDLKLKFRSYTNTFDPDCNSLEVLNTIFGNEVALFKNIYIKIDDCPEWTKEELTNMREKEIREDNKRQKRLEFKRKIFPWIKR